MKSLIYLHGFASSPQSQKAQSLMEWLMEHAPEVAFIVPQLPFCVADAKTLIDDLCQETEASVLIGSSLGGFYATYASQWYSLKAALVNPAVAPDTLLGDRPRDVQSYYTDERYTITDDDLATLREMRVTLDSPELLRVLIETGDETLDYRDALKHYGESRCWLEYGGNHRCESFECYLPKIREFLEF